MYGHPLTCREPACRPSCYGLVWSGDSHKACFPVAPIRVGFNTQNSELKTCCGPGRGLRASTPACSKLYGPEMRHASAQRVIWRLFCTVSRVLAAYLRCPDGLAGTTHKVLVRCSRRHMGTDGALPTLGNRRMECAGFSGWIAPGQKGCDGGRECV